MEPVLLRGIVPHPSLIAEEGHTFLQARLRTRYQSETGKPVDQGREAAPHPILGPIESLSPCRRTSDAAPGTPGESAADSSQSPRTIPWSQVNSPCPWRSLFPKRFFVLPSQKIIENRAQAAAACGMQKMCAGITRGLSST